MTIPTISLDCSTEAEIATALREAARTSGFFYLEGHSISRILIEKVLSQTKQLFSLPLSEKESLFDPSLQRGYTRFEEETLDPKTQLRRGDTKEGFYIGKDLPREESKLRGPNVWPAPSNCLWTDEKCQTFRDTMENYRSEASRVCQDLIRYFSLAVDPEKPDLLAPFFKEPTTSVRLLHYSAEPSDPDDGVFGCGAHSDYGMITLLLTDDNPGLQVQLNDSNWVDVPPREGAFVVNIGDMFERWTNGKFRSTVHRVLTPRGGKERYSVPFFYEPDFDAVVECLDACCDEDNPPKYPPITAGQHLLNMYGKTHADFVGASNLNKKMKTDHIA